MFQIHSLYSDLKPLPALNIQTISTDATTVGNVIDTKNYGRIQLGMFMGTMTDGDYELTIYEDEAVGMGGEAVVPADRIVGTRPDMEDHTAEDDTIEWCEIVNTLRYVRVKVVSTNTSSGATLGVFAILGAAEHGPVTTAEASQVP